MYGDVFRYGMDSPVGAPEVAEVVNVGNPISSAVHLKSVNVSQWKKIEVSRENCNDSGFTLNLLEFLFPLL